MTKAEDLLKKRIEEYNNNISYTYQFAFDKKETDFFVSIIKEYARIKCDEQREICYKAADDNPFNEEAAVRRTPNAVDLDTPELLNP